MEGYWFLKVFIKYIRDYGEWKIIVSIMLGKMYKNVIEKKYVMLRGSFV